MAVGAANARLLVKLPLVAVSVVLALPCKIRFWVVEPIVSAAPGFITVRLVRLVISLLAPLAAAPRAERAPPTLVAPVPPLPMLSALVRLRLANVGLDVVAIFCGKLSVIAPVAPDTLT